jgi:Chaperone of endosialidase
MSLFRLKDRTYTNQKFNGSALLLVVLVLACSAISPMAQAVVPPPDGAYPGGNTAEGQAALLSLTTGGFNTAIGWVSLHSNTTASFNTGVGAGTLFRNIAEENTAIGAGAMLSNSTGLRNTATGAFALFSNTTGVANTVNGFQALYSNTTGGNNTANGFLALQRNTIGTENTAVGTGALQFNTIGDWNTAEGFDALVSNTTGRNNTANGFQALVFNTTGHDNIALGSFAGDNLTTGDNNIVIGNEGVAAESDTIRVGTQGTQTNAYVAGIFGTTVPNGVPVIVDPTGHLGTIASSQRFKNEIKPMDKTSEAILGLKPVTFHYKGDAKGTPQFGLIAEEVAEVNPDLVVRNENGEIYTVRYDAVNAMLLNEFLKEHRKNEQQESKIEQQEAKIARQQKQIEALTEGLQKVSTQLEASRPAPQVVNNP